MYDCTPFIYMFTPAMTRILYFCIINIKIRLYRPSKFVHFFEKYVGYTRSFVFPYKLYNVYQFLPEIHWYTDWNYIKPINSLGRKEPQGRWSLVDCHLWGHTESDWSNLAAAAAENDIVLQYEIYVAFVPDSWHRAPKIIRIPWVIAMSSVIPNIPSAHSKVYLNGVT